MTYRPIIGISANFTEETSRIANAYVEAVAAAGGLPIVLPVTENTALTTEMVQQIDGLILSGGGDMHPSFFNEKPIPELGEVSLLRDKFDLKLLEEANNRQIPILGICRGEQLINVYFGGSLFQDMPSQYEAVLVNHNQEGEKPKGIHDITVNPDSKLAQITGCNTLFVNSFHHQAVKMVAPKFNAVAHTSDGIVEAIESDNFPHIVAVQWHPEQMAYGDDNAPQKKLFTHLVREATIYKQAKYIHAKYPIIDSHCDTPMVFHKDFDFGRDRNDSQINLPKMEEGDVSAIFMAAYIPQKHINDVSTAQAIFNCRKLLDGIDHQLTQNNDRLEKAYSAKDIRRIKQQGKRALIMAIENGFALGYDISLLDEYYNRGVRYLTLCHNGDNALCDSAKGNSTYNGLSPLGRLTVRKMNELGMMIDLSHASEATFWDVIKCSNKPIIASHSSARALCDHPRNLDDAQLQALAQNGGVCQVCLYSDFLSETGIASVETALDHIDHIVKIVGIDFVGIGSDFDGGGGINGCNGSNDLIAITAGLIRRGYKEDEIAKIWGGNLLRVFENQENK